MSKHIGSYSSLHGPAGKPLVDYTEQNIPSLWHHAPERIEDIMNSGSQYTGFIPGWTDTNPFILTEDKLFFFTPHVTSLVNPRLSINGLPLAFIKEADARSSTLPAGYFVPDNDYLLRWKDGLYEVLVNLTTLASDLRSGGEEGGGGGDAARLDSDILIADYQGEADTLETSGFTSYRDGGGKIWKRGGTSAPVTTPPLPSYFKRQSFDGHWYEAISTRTVEGEKIGLFGQGSSVDAGPAVNEILAWLGAKGGGRLVLPPGITYSNQDLLSNYSGIWLQGTTVGASSGNAGSVLHLASDKTFDIGTAGGPTINAFKCSDLKCGQVAGTTAYFFHSHNIRGMKFRDLQLNGIYGFLHAGDPITGSFSRVIYMEGIEGNLHTGVAEHFIFAENIGHITMTSVVCEGGWDPGQTVLYQPNGTTFTQNVPDGILIANCGFSLWDFGLVFEKGVSNLLVSNTWLDRMQTTALKLDVRTSCGGNRFNNCHFVGGLPMNENQIGIYIGEASNTLQRVEISDSTIAHWGQSALVVANSVNGLSILNNHFEDNCGGGATSALYPVVVLGGDDPGSLNLRFSGNTIYRASTTGDFAKQPLNGIVIDTPAPTVEVTNNLISGIAPSGATIVNPHRESAKTRKVYGNSGQVLEGTSQMLGPWCRSIVSASLDSSTLSFLGEVPTADSGCIHIVAVSRGRFIGIWLEALGEPDFTTLELIAIQVNPTINGDPQPFPAILSGGELYSYNTPVGDGIEFNAGDKIGMRITTADDLVPDDMLSVTAGLIVYYD